MENNLKFLIIGSMNAITYKETFKYIKENKLWLGYNSVKQFRTSDGGIKNFGNICWFTNLDTEKRHIELPLSYSYKENPTKYPKYDNYDAINVDKVKEIPYDYDGYIGVPVTFLNLYNPEQFEIKVLGIVGSCEFTKNVKMEILKNGEPTGKFVYNAKGTLYKKYNPNIDKILPNFRNAETGELYLSVYARIIIKNKYPEL